MIINSFGIPKTKTKTKPTAAKNPKTKQISTKPKIITKYQ